MQQKRYDIDKCDNEWIVSANGNGLLRCSQKKWRWRCGEGCTAALDNSVRQGGLKAQG